LEKYADKDKKYKKDILKELKIKENNTY